MRALVGGLGKDVRLIRDYPEPSILRDGAILRVRRAAITRTDIEIVNGYRDHHGPLGHGFVADVVDVAQGHEEWLGARVVAEINFGCGGPLCVAFGEDFCPHRFVLGIAALDCPHAEGKPVVGGALADLVSLPVRKLHRVPDHVSDSDAAFCELLAAAIRILEQVHVKPTDRVVVLGDGPFAFMIAQVMTWPGCEVTTIGKYPEKLGFFAECGIGVCENGDGWDGWVDLVVDATGSPTGLEWALRHTRPRGTIVMKNTVRASGKEIDLSPAVVSEISLISSRSGPFAPAVQAFATGRVIGEPYVSDRFSLDDGVAAVRRASTKGVRRVEVIVTSGNVHGASSQGIEEG